MPEESTKHQETHKPSSDYVELKLPKILRKSSPVNLFLLGLCILFSFLLGAAGMRLYALENQDAVPTDAIGMFTSYAKKLRLNSKDFRSCLESGKYASTVEEDLNAGQDVAVNATPAFFINGQPLIGAQPYEVFKTVIDQELSGNPAPTPTVDPLISEPPAQVAKQDVALGHLPLLGKDSAKVTIVEFSDLQCPFCKRFVDDTFSQLKKDYIDTGKVKLAFRHFPLNIHKNAQKAAEAAECAHEQGKFWQFHDMVFSQQDIWSNMPTQATSST